MKGPLFFGACVAMVTPFRNGGVDYAAMKEMIIRQLKSGIDAVLVLGTTGESSTVSDGERRNIIAMTRSVVPDDVALIVGTGTNDTNTTVLRTMQAREAGADGVLIVTPYYNKCTQEGAVAHYEAISNAVDIPIIMYHIPSRTGVTLSLDTIKRIAGINNVVGVKDCSRDILLIMSLMEEVSGDAAIYSGDDALNLVYLSLGASGVISVSANIAPEMSVDMCRLGYGDMLAAKSMQRSLKNIDAAMSVELNPSPVKYALSLMKLCREDVRLPLVKLSKNSKKVVKTAVEEYLNKKL